VAKASGTCQPMISHTRIPRRGSFSF